MDENQQKIIQDYVIDINLQSGSAMESDFEDDQKSYDKNSDIGKNGDSQEYNFTTMTFLPLKKLN